MGSSLSFFFFLFIVDVVVVDDDVGVVVASAAFGPQSCRQRGEGNITCKERNRFLIVCFTSYFVFSIVVYMPFCLS